MRRGQVSIEEEEEVNRDDDDDEGGCRVAEAVDFDLELKDDDDEGIE